MAYRNDIFQQASTHESIQVMLTVAIVNYSSSASDVTKIHFPIHFLLWRMSSTIKIYGKTMILKNPVHV